MKFFGEIVADSKDVTIPIILRDLSGVELTGLRAADVTFSYLRSNGLPQTVNLVDLVRGDVIHSDGGWFEYDIINQPGIYRLDLPDEAVAEGAEWVLFSVIALNSLNYHERYALAQVNEEQEGLFLSVGLQNYYITIDDADAYFDTKLNSDLWPETVRTDRIKALQMATKLIDRLNFSGDKTDENQQLEFPRNGDTIVPEDIQIACAEIAFALLDGADTEKNLKEQFIISHSFANTRTERKHDLVEEHHRAGIPSAWAWNYLKPYLADIKSVKLYRV